MLRTTALLGSLLLSSASFAADAFPGALGYGKAATGGRGGAIVYVTTTADSGPGSLRACLDMTTPRNCIFRTGGIFRFTTQRPIINDAKLSLLGQTAPGGGVVITHAGGATGFTPIAIKNTNNIIIRHVNVMLDQTTGSTGSSNDNFTVEESSDVIIDHVTGAWAMDEAANGFDDANRVTFQWSIFGEPVQPHDKCALLGGDAENPVNVSFLRNLCAHAGDRNPDASDPTGSCFEVSNNVLYDPASQFTEFNNSQGSVSAVIRNNYYKKGPSTASAAAAIDAVEPNPPGLPAHNKLFWSGNTRNPSGMTEATPLAVTSQVLTNPCPSATAPLLESSATLSKITASNGAGAFPRTSFSARMISETLAGTGHTVKVPGSIGSIAAGTPYVDVDLDGMPDSLEAANGGGNPAVFDPWGDPDGDGLMTFDEVMDKLHLMRLAGQYPS